MAYAGSEKDKARKAEWRKAHPDYAKEWRVKNKEKIQIRSAAYYQENKEHDRERNKERSKTYRLKNKDKVRDNYIRWRAKNPDYAYNYAKAHPDRIAKASAKWQAKNRARIKAYDAARVLSNPQYHREKAKRWREKNRDKIRENDATRKARHRGAKIRDFTAEQWSLLQELFAHSCVYCGRFMKGKLTRDHVKPIARGGNHTILNILPSCALCNGRKHAGPALPFHRPLRVLKITFLLWRLYRLKRI